MILSKTISLDQYLKKLFDEMFELLTRLKIWIVVVIQNLNWNKRLTNNFKIATSKYVIGHIIMYKLKRQ
jgi:hypothetical protein